MEPEIIHGETIGKRNPNCAYAGACSTYSNLRSLGSGGLLAAIGKSRGLVQALRKEIKGFARNRGPRFTSTLYHVIP